MYDELGSGDENSGFVPVVFAQDPNEVDFYRSLLEDYGIEVRIDEDYHDRNVDSGDVERSVHEIAVLVDLEHLAEAEAAIKHRIDEEELGGDDGADFYEDEDGDEFEGLQEFDPEKDV